MTVPHKGKIAFGYATLRELCPSEAEALVVAIDDLSISASKVAIAFSEAVGRFHRDFRVSPRAINHLRQELDGHEILARDYFKRFEGENNVA